jgi:glycosyltransferase involved in cell wall biosynthesis
MKSVIINTVCNQGSTGKLSYLLCKYFVSCGDESIVVYGGGNVCKEECAVLIGNKVGQKLHNFLGRLTGLNGCFSSHTTEKIIKKLKEYKPDVIYLGNLHGHYVNIYKLYQYIKKAGIPCIQIMWDEYPMTGSCSFAFDCKKYEERCHDCPRKKDYPISWFFDTSSVLQKKKKRAYVMKYIAFVAVPYTAECAKKSLLLKDKRIYPADEAVDQKKLYYPRETTKLRKELGIPHDNKVILDVCVYPGERKGGKFFLETAGKCLEQKDITFVHVGFLGDKDECPENYIPIGFEKDQNRMAEYYSLADLFVCTSFAETQPNTCLEALSCGTPICGFDISGIPTCAEAPFGKYVMPKDTDALKEVVLATPKKTPESIYSVTAYARSRFSSEDYNRKLRNIGLEIISLKSKG